jgi:hypothetical protein
MKVLHVNGRDYRLPGNLSGFQEHLYIHLIDWKQKNITSEAGFNEYRGRRIPYDAILPERMADELPLVYPPVRERLRQHHAMNPFRKHSFFNHMVSSQVANVNLFLPVLCHPVAQAVLKQLKPDFISLATDHLDHGFCLEFWGGNFDGNGAEGGPLGDKSATRGTDSDIAIAYRNPAGELCLWLIEHKLCEKEFTPCSGPKSKDRNPARHDCASSFAGILENKHTCFHHDVNQRKYWDITHRHRHLFAGQTTNGPCPFQGGMNQLWRNLLLALALEQDDRQPYAHASFSVVKHPANPHLDDTIAEFKNLLGDNPKFSVFTSEDLLKAAEAVHDPSLDQWTRWYRDLYLP